MDLCRIDAPVYIYAPREDHIVPWKGAYLSTQAVSGNKLFVLGAPGNRAFKPIEAAPGRYVKVKASA